MNDMNLRGDTVLVFNISRQTDLRTLRQIVFLMALAVL